MGMNRSEYARHRQRKGYRGCTRQSVSKAVKAGRIRLEPDGTIDPQLADALWAANTKQQRRKPDELTAMRGERYQDAKADLETARAAKAQLELERTRGDLVPRADVEAAVRDAFTAVRSRLQAWPARLSTQLAAVKGAERVRSVLTAEVDALLADLAQSVRGLAGDA